MRMRFASILVSDEDRAVAFYRDQLGFQLLVDQPLPFGGRFLMFQPPDGGAKLVASRPIPGRPGTPGGPTNISWETADVQQLYEELSAKGVTFPKPPAKAMWGGLEAQFADPDGNIFLLVQGGPALG